MTESPYSLKGKTILVTGASSGIGRSCAVAASQMGAKLIFTGRDKERLAEVGKILDGVGHESRVFDLLDTHGLDAFSADLPPLDGMLFAAGQAKVVPFRMIDDLHIKDLLSLNFTAPVMLTRSILRTKRLKRGASLLYVAAVADHVAPPGTAIYAASKAALIAAMKSLALEVSKQGVRVNCLSPGYVQTPMFEKLNGAASVTDLVKFAPLGLIDPVQVATSAIYLLSDAARWVTRTNLVVDSGITIPVR